MPLSLFIKSLAHCWQGQTGHVPDPGVGFARAVIIIICAVFGDVFQNSEFLLDEAEEDNEDAEEKQVEDGDKETDKDSIDGEKLEKSENCDSVLKHPSTESTLMLFKDSSSKMG